MIVRPAAPADAYLEGWFVVADVSFEAHKALGFREIERIHCFLKKL